MGLTKPTIVMVRKALEGNVKARDNDRLIHAAIWNHEAKVNHVESIPEFLTAYLRGKFTDPNAMSRVRRKLQELYPELRGEKYKERQEKYQDDAKDKVKKMK